MNFIRPFCLTLILCSLAGSSLAQNEVERWGLYEVTLDGPSNGNPYKDVQLMASFSQGNNKVDVTGFYDGNGKYKIRFMPDQLGEWQYTTASNQKQLHNNTGRLTCTITTGNNHGPVRVAHQYHFAYADGMPYKPFGTTCYAWTHQNQTLQDQTLKTLATSPFNKIRMCLFPKNYSYNENSPDHYVFEGDSKENFDFGKFNPAYWANLEKRLLQLQALGVEADLILFHPYDNGKWGFDQMPAAVDDFYLQYVTARLSAFRNVWWSLANEFHFMKSRKQTDWDRYGKILTSTDPHGHLLSNHNGADVEFDWSKDYITHVGAQHYDQTAVAAFVEKYQKPVINDEAQYEGDLFLSWGNISANELVHRYWLGAVNGIYTTHGETFLDENQVLWWSKGGVLKGQSAPRIAFLRKILEEGPAEGINNFSPGPFWKYFAAGDNEKYLLLYFGMHQPSIWYFNLPEHSTFAIDLIDTWNMTITPYQEIFSGRSKVVLPAKPHMALRVRKID